jgi:hypothetical protein
MMRHKKEWYLPAGVLNSNCVAAYQPKGAINTENSYLNIARPGIYTIVPGVATPTWDSVNGWIFDNVSTAVLNTNITIGSNAWTVIIRYVCNGTGSSGGGRIFSGNLDKFTFQPNQGGTQIFTNGGASSSFGTFLIGSHVSALSNNMAYTDKTLMGILTTATLGQSPLAIGNRLSDLARQFYGNIQGLAIYNVALTSSQINEITDMMNANF